MCYKAGLELMNTTLDLERQAKSDSLDALRRTNPGYSLGGAVLNGSSKLSEKKM